MSLTDASTCLTAALQSAAADLQRLEHALEVEFRRKYAREVSYQRRQCQLETPPPPPGGGSALGARPSVGNPAVAVIAVLAEVSRCGARCHLTAQVNPMDLLHKLRKLKRCEASAAMLMSRPPAPDLAQCLKARLNAPDKLAQPRLAAFHGRCQHLAFA